MLLDWYQESLIVYGLSSIEDISVEGYILRCVHFEIFVNCIILPDVAFHHCYCFVSLGFHDGCLDFLLFHPRDLFVTI